MKFFDDIKTKLEDTLEDLTTVEHVLIIEDSNEFIYRFQQTAGDSLCHLGEGPVNPEYISLFNDAFSASMEARTGIGQFLIECLKPK